LARSSGSSATLLTVDDTHATLRLPSKKIINIDKYSLATLGEPSNGYRNLTVKGKAGVNRWLGKRPTVRGYAMNPFDHPHGGKTKGGFNPKTF
jgi:large subunit ribosomal protein L2